MGSHLRETILSLPGSEWEKEDYLNLIEQLDEEGFDDFTRVRELLGLAVPGRITVGTPCVSVN
ncbi:hypothetical protein ACLB1Q_10330 [Escherichia coli]